MIDNQIKFDLLKTELELVQRQIDKYDQLSATVKTWTVTLWAAIFGWSFQSKQQGLILIALFIVLIFWVIDAVNKNFRQDYKARRAEIAQALQEYFKNSEFSSEMVAPRIPDHTWFGVLKYVLEPHIFLIYSALIIVSLLSFFVQK